MLHTHFWRQLAVLLLHPHLGVLAVEPHADQAWAVDQGGRGAASQECMEQGQCRAGVQELGEERAV